MKMPYELPNLMRVKHAVQIGKTLKSAIANAEHNAGLSAEGLIVKNAIIDGGPMMKRFRPRARGSLQARFRRRRVI